MAVLGDFFLWFWVSFEWFSMVLMGKIVLGNLGWGFERTLVSSKSFHFWIDCSFRKLMLAQVASSH